MAKKKDKKFKKVVKKDKSNKKVNVKIKKIVPNEFMAAPVANKKEKGEHVVKIKVVGVGGGGGNAISRMFDYFPRGVDLVAVNTDLQDLQSCQAKKRIYIGKQVTKGLGAGMNPELGRQAAEESREEIARALEGSDMIFITAGLGGGTGSGAVPVIAEIAQEMGILTATIVTKPFSFEGNQRMQIAQDALAKIKDRVDTLITISNDRIFSLIDKETSLQKAFEAIDEVLKNAVLGVTELIVSAGVINVDFADIRTIIQNSGSSIIGVGIASGKERAIMAANLALNSPLLETTIDGAKGVLFSISGHKDIRMNEVNDIAKLISENVDPNAKIIFGTYYDRKLSKGQIKVTLIATGFGMSFGRNSSLFSDFDTFSKNENTGPALKSSQGIMEMKIVRDDKKEHIVEKKEILEIDVGLEKSGDEDEAWDIPAFLRRKNKRR